MSTAGHPQPLLKRTSIFRRFSQRKSALASPTPQPHAPRKLQRRSTAAQTGLLTPPHSPKPYTITNVDATKQQHHQPKMVAHIQQVELPPRASDPPRPDFLHSSANVPTQHPERVLPTALPTALPTTPFPGDLLIRPWNVFLPPSQVFALYLGFLPQEPSDKWFIYSEGPDSAGKLKVHFHRRCTGLKIAELFVVMDVRGEGAGKLVGIKWNGSVEANRMAEAEAKNLVATTCKWVLGVELEEGLGGR